MGRSRGQVEGFIGRSSFPIGRFQSNGRCLTPWELGLFPVWKRRVKGTTQIVVGGGEGCVPSDVRATWGHPS